MNLDEPDAASMSNSASRVAEWMAGDLFPPVAPLTTAQEPIARDATLMDSMFDLAAPDVSPVVARLVPLGTATKASIIEIIDPVTNHHETDIDTKPSDTSESFLITLGRGKDVPMPLRIASPRVSSKHCVLRVFRRGIKANCLEIMDISTNGTWVNGRKLVKGRVESSESIWTPLKDGDTVTFINPTLTASGNQDKCDYTLQQIAEVTQPEKKIEGTAMKASLENMKCPICHRLLYRPVAVLPCLHTFCSHCISQWLKVKCGSALPPLSSHNKLPTKLPKLTIECPECRTKIEEIRPQHKLVSVIEDLELLHADHKISVEDKDAADKENMIAVAGVSIGCSKRARSDSPYGSEFSGSMSSRGSDYEEEEEEEEDSGSPAAHHGFVPFGKTFLPGMYVPLPGSTSCPECTTPSPLDGFQCPPFGNHLKCLLCKTTFPDRPLLSDALPQKCFVCTQPFCDIYLGGCKNPAGRGYLQPIDDHELDKLPTGSLFGGNTVEIGILTAYLEQVGMTAEELWKECRTKMQTGVWVPDVVSVSGPPRVDSPVCKPCAQRIFSSLIYHYRRAIPRTELPMAIAERPDCWHGVHCRTQKHSLMHAQKYNHVCAQVKRKE